MKLSLKYVLVGCGAALGAMLRYGSELLIGSAFSDDLAVLLINLAGCFIIALVSAAFLKKQLSVEWKTFLTTGFCGGFTTFSSLATGLLTLLQKGSILLAFSYSALNLVLGLIALFVGFQLILGPNSEETSR